ncbi:MAG: hypothetical protein ACJ73S_18505 [Mycobacteriales bacterium]
MSELRRSVTPDDPTPDTPPDTPPVQAADRRPAIPPDKPRYYFEQLDTPPAADRPSPRELLLAFDPARAHLPDIPAEQVPRYLDDRADERLWLRSCWGQPPEVRRVIAILDAGDGHALERHEGYPGDPELRLRVQQLQDPAQLDPTKRAAALDAYTNRLHFCAAEATRIKDPAAFATAFVTGLEHPQVKALLDAPYTRQPEPIQIPIEELLGPEGHRFCAGYRLEEVDGSIEAARAQRKVWVKESVAGGHPDPSDLPGVRPIESFEGGKLEFRLKPTAAQDGHYVATMFPIPPEHEGEV